MGTSLELDLGLMELFHLKIFSILGEK